MNTSTGIYHSVPPSDDAHHPFTEPTITPLPALAGTEFRVTNVRYQRRPDDRPELLAVELVGTGGPLHGLLLNAYVPSAVVSNTLQGRELDRAATGATNQEAKDQR